MRNYRKKVSFITVVGLTGLILGNIEGLWVIIQDPPLIPREAMLLLFWSSTVYAISVMLIAGSLISANKVLKRTDWHVTQIPAVLFPVGVLLGVVLFNHIHTVGFLSTLLIQLPASAFLSLGVCYLLNNRLKRWSPLPLNSLKMWLFLQVLTLSITITYIANMYTLISSRLTIISAAATVIFCIWGFKTTSSITKPLMGAICTTIITVILFIGWPSNSNKISGRAGEKSNVLLITIDTLRADHLGSYGYKDGQTPNIDNMASNGLTFMEAHASSAFTVPSHVSILTGLDPLQHGAICNDEAPIKNNILTLPMILGNEGYETAAFISGGPLKHKFSGLGNHFHTYVEDFSPWHFLPESIAKIRIFKIVTKLVKYCGFKFVRYERKAEETTNDVIHWLQRPHSRPFFLWVHYFDPHIPYSPPAPYNMLFDPSYTGAVDGRWYELNIKSKEKIITNRIDMRHMIALYDGEIAYVDSQVGRLLDTLNRLKIKQTTLVILTSDHGESHGEHNGYFRRDLYRTCLHVPLIINFPNEKLRKQIVQEQVRLIDVTPTVLEYLKIKNHVSFAGRSLLNLAFSDKPDGNRPNFSLLVYPPNNPNSIEVEGDFAIQDLGYKLIWNSGEWTKGDERLQPWEELYGLTADINENINILKNTPSVASDLRERLTKWRSQITVNNVKPSQETMEMLKSLGYVR